VRAATRPVADADSTGVGLAGTLLGLLVAGCGSQFDNVIEND